VGQGTEGGGNNTGLAELQKRLERKVDVDVVDQLLRASNNTKDVRIKIGFTIMYIDHIPMAILVLVLKTIYIIMNQYITIIVCKSKNLYSICL